MKAVVYEEYGPPDVLRLKDIARPVPKDNEILIRVFAVTVTIADCRVRSLRVPRGFGLLARLALGVTKPRQAILGAELAGQVAQVGKEVRNFKVGDRVFAFTDTAMGCYVEYKTMPEDGAVALAPTNLSIEEAASLSFGGTTALYFLRKAKLQRGERLLINGAAGGVGSAMVQLARYFGAEVTGVCSTAKVDMVRALGADHVIDYTQEDFTRNGKTYHVIVDASGTLPFSRSKASLQEGGRLVLLVAGLLDMLVLPWVALMSGKKVIVGTATGQVEDLRFLVDLAEKGQYRPVIDQVFPLERIVEAHRYVDAGHKKGNVIATVA